MGLYPDFTCMAGRCPSTCCSGWKITVDPESYHQFTQMQEDGLRQDILESLIEEDGQFRFANRADGSCVMLDRDGLCRIQRNAGEGMLCHTCRKFPRITAYTSTAESGYRKIIWLSLAASCPVVADWILDGAVSWLWLDTNGRLHPLSPTQQTDLCNRTGMPGAEGFRDTVWRPSEFFDILVNLAVDVLDVFVSFREIPYLEDSFDLFDAEEPDFQSFADFFCETESSWQKFVQQYTYYRYPSRFLEFPEETACERTQQIQGELILMRMMLCSRYVLRGGCIRTDWQDILHWVYRCCVHGKSSADRMHQLFSSWREDVLQTAYQNVCLGHG